MLEGIDDDMRDLIIEELALDLDYLGQALNNRLPLDDITDTASRGKLAVRLEEQFGVDVLDDAVGKWVTLQDVIDTINSLQKR
ncbi:hypothetical protein AB0D59_48220 [Streptomyces sp. NPDC048417]|uniref:hypothetical protein n=1 Tax=Streptomyces sp. NPDC048417 TaxID=3155387 RepID=UPI003436BC9B